MKWYNRRRTGYVAAATAPLFVAALVFAHQGFPVARLDLDDGGVWITSRADAALGRFNVPVTELDGGLGATSQDFDVLQDGADVLLVEGTEISVVDPAAVATASRASVEAGATVGMAGGTVVVANSAGHVWASGLDNLPQLASGSPDADLGPGAKAVVASSGTVFAVDAAGDVTTVSREGRTAKNGTIKNLRAIDQITAVGDEVVVLDGSTVRTKKGAVQLQGTGLVLQQPGPSASTVVVASADALFEVPLGGGSPTVRSKDSGPAAGSPVAAAPVRVAGCIYGAWAAETGNWMRVCGSDVDTTDREAITPAAELRFRVNRTQVVLNDMATGRAWLPDAPQVNEPAWNLITPRPDEDTQSGDGDQPTVEHTTLCSEEGKAPVAHDDEYGVRPGRSTTLRVLANDTTADCGVLVISAVDPIPDDFGTVRVVDSGRALEVDVLASATGSVAFTYTATDRPGMRAPATGVVRLTVHDWSQNSPPQQVSTTSVRLGQGETLSVGVLSDFFDPDGDPLALVNASMHPRFGSVVFRPDGVVTVTSSGQLGTTEVTLSVTDGIGPVVVGKMEVSVVEGATNPTVDPVHVVGYVDRPLVVSPLAAVRSSGTEPVRLAGVGEVPGISITHDLVAGTFTVLAPRAGTYYVSFTVVAAPNQTVGWARIDIVDLPGQVLPPVTATDIAYLPGGGSVTVDPLVNDFDPNDLVLVLQSVSVPDGSGLQAGVVDHRLVVISSVRTLEWPEAITYLVSNGEASATGTIIVVPVPPPATNQPPVVPDRQVSVRTGGVVTVDVLSGAYDPDGGPLALDPQLLVAPAEGLLVVSGDVLRYQAPDRPMTVSALFQVTDSGGASTAARLVVNVHASSAASKPPPVPKDIVARVFEGETARIKIPLTGIDVDGDGVMLLGVADVSPQLGDIVKVGADYMEYRARPGYLGTDTFTYAVEDWTGQRAVATVQVGVVPRSSEGAQVIARDDEVVLRPGVLVEVAVLANDINSGGGDLWLDPELNFSGDLATATAVATDGMVRVEAKQPGIVQVQYTARNDLGGQGTAVLTVTVKKDAPVLAPVAKDIVVPPEETIGRTQVEVDVLAVARNPSGPLSELTVEVPSSSARTASAPGGKVLLITLTDTSQVVAYRLVNGRDRTATSYAFVTVPALGFFPPALRPRAPELRVASGESITIDLAQQVQVAPGRKPSLFKDAELKADKGKVAADGTTKVQFTADAGFAGRASVTLRVTDSTGSDDPEARDSWITIPVTVVGEALPPTFTATTVAVGPGDSPVSVDLNAFMKTPEGSKPAVGLYTYSISGAVPDGFSVTLNGSRLAVGAAVGAEKGALGRLTVTVGYGQSSSMDIAIPLKVVASTRPLARVLNRTFPDGEAGAARTVDVLADAFDPFGAGLTVVSAVVETPDAGTASHTASTVTVRPGDDFLGTMVTRFTVQDVTGDPDRQVEARITLHVAAVPEAPAPPRVAEIRDKAVVLAWTAPDGRGLEILEYRVTVSDDTKVLCPSTTCVVSGLSNGTTYTFTVAARNAVGWSPESEPSSAGTPDAVPDAPRAPTVTAGNGSVDATWAAPGANGSAIGSYDVEISPRPDSPNNPATIKVSTTSARFSGLTNGRAYTVRVRAHNSSPTPGPWSDWSVAVTPVNAPDAPRGLAASPLGDGQLQVTWQRPPDNGMPLLEYELVVAGGGTSTIYHPAVDATSQAVTAQNNVQYTITLRARNALGWSAPATTQGSTFGVPGAPQVTEAVGQVGGASGQGTVRVTLSPGADGGSPITSYQVRVNNGAAVTLNGTSGTVGGLQGGQAAVVYAMACNQRGCSTWSAGVPAVPTPQTVPGAVGGLRVDVAANGSEATANWSAPDWGGGTGQQYRVVWKVNGDEVTSTTTTALTARLTQGLPGSVTVTVSAVTSVGGGPDASASAAANVVEPAAPANVWVTDLGSPIGFAWDAVPGATGYDWIIYRDGTEAASGSTTRTSQTASVENAAGSALVILVRAVVDGRPSSWTQVRANP
ncbi:MAG: fibronectin type III domain-containing protein [Micrococcales bacterium]|nr:fibronectin type III domain-containing protein [Micrococcales bacterium]MCL2667130.1 fibronectin type III domain-containing protein [Micrococcales bacterium]